MLLAASYDTLYLCRKKSSWFVRLLAFNGGMRWSLLLFYFGFVVFTVFSRDPLLVSFPGGGCCSLSQSAGLPLLTLLTTQREIHYHNNNVSTRDATKILCCRCRQKLGTESIVSLSVFFFPHKDINKSGFTSVQCLQLLAAAVQQYIVRGVCGATSLSHVI